MFQLHPLKFCKAFKCADFVGRFEPFLSNYNVSMVDVPPEVEYCEINSAHSLWGIETAFFSDFPDGMWLHYLPPT